MHTLRLVVADDHEVVRKGLRRLLQSHPGWEVCGEAKTGREAIDSTRKLKPDILILDIGMPELNGVEAARLIRRISPQTQILVLTIHDSEDLVRELLQIGVRGYMMKTDAGRDLVAATEAVSQGKPFFSSRVGEMVLQGYLAGITDDRAQGTPVARLSGREREIIQLLAEGKTNKEIAGRLSLSVKTVETHRMSIMHKLNLHSIGELTRYAVRNKIIMP